MDRQRCGGTNKAGEPCGSFAVKDGLCISHHPELRLVKAAATRKGGEAKANARRAAKAWAAMGDVVETGDLPAILRSCMFSVKAGTLEPSQAHAIAALAKTSVAITNEIELEKRIAALEEAAGVATMPDNVRKFA